MPPEMEVLNVLPGVKPCERQPNAVHMKHGFVTHLARRECPYCGNFQIVEICDACVRSIERHMREGRKWNCLKCHKTLEASALVVIGRA